MADIYVTAEITDLGDIWKVVAYAEKEYEFTAPTDAEAREGFLSMWNETHDTNYEMENVDFVIRESVLGE